MKNVKKILIFVAIIVIVCVLFCIIKNGIFQKTTEIPEDYEFKIVIDFETTPVTLTTYYFYEDMVIKENYSGGVVASGPKIDKEFTRYYYNKNISFDNLINEIDNELGNISIKNTEDNTLIFDSRYSVSFFELSSLEDKIDSVISKLAKE